MWQQKKAAGTLKRPSLAEIFSPELRTRHDRHDADVRDVVRRGVRRDSADAAHRAGDAARSRRSTLSRPMPPDPAGAAQWRAEVGRMKQRVAAAVQWWQEIGGLAGRTLLAMLVLVIVSRRRTAAAVPGARPHRRARSSSGWRRTRTCRTLKIGMFFAGLFTVAQFSFWGNYLPRVYPTHLRGTGEGFAANVGGRMLGTGLRVRDDDARVESVRAAARAAREGRGDRRRVRVCLRRGTQLLVCPEPKSDQLPE